MAIAAAVYVDGYNLYYGRIRDTRFQLENYDYDGLLTVQPASSTTCVPCPASSTRT